MVLLNHSSHGNEEKLIKVNRLIKKSS